MLWIITSICYLWCESSLELCSTAGFNTTSFLINVLSPRMSKQVSFKTTKLMHPFLFSAMQFAFDVPDEICWNILMDLYFKQTPTPPNWRIHLYCIGAWFQLSFTPTSSGINAKYCLRAVTFAASCSQENNKKNALWLNCSRSNPHANAKEFALYFIANAIFRMSHLGMSMANPQSQIRFSTINPQHPNALPVSRRFHA